MRQKHSNKTATKYTPDFVHADAANRQLAEMHALLAQSAAGSICYTTGLRIDAPIVAMRMELASEKLSQENVLSAKRCAYHALATLIGDLVRAATTHYLPLRLATDKEIGRYGAMKRLSKTSLEHLISIEKHKNHGNRAAHHFLVKDALVHSVHPIFPRFGRTPSELLFLPAPRASTADASRFLSHALRSVGRILAAANAKRKDAFRHLPLEESCRASLFNTRDCSKVSKQIWRSEMRRLREASPETARTFDAMLDASELGQAGDILPFVIQNSVGRHLNAEHLGHHDAVLVTEHYLVDRSLFDFHGEESDAALPPGSVRSVTIYRVVRLKLDAVRTPLEKARLRAHLEAKSVPDRIAELFARAKADSPLLVHHLDKLSMGRHAVKTLSSVQIRLTDETSRELAKARLHEKLRAKAVRSFSTLALPLRPNAGVHVPPLLFMQGTKLLAEGVRESDPILACPFSQHYVSNWSRLTDYFENFAFRINLFGDVIDKGIVRCEQ